MTLLTTIASYFNSGKSITWRNSGLSAMVDVDHNISVNLISFDRLYDPEKGVSYRKKSLSEIYEDILHEFIHLDCMENKVLCGCEGGNCVHPCPLEDFVEEEGKKLCRENIFAFQYLKLRLGEGIVCWSQGVEILGGGYRQLLLF